MSAFTEREIEVLQAMVDHGGSKRAAHALGLSERTVRNTLANMRAKAGVDTTVQLVTVAGDRVRAPQRVGQTDT